MAELLNLLTDRGVYRVRFGDWGPIWKNVRNEAYHLIERLHCVGCPQTYHVCLFDDVACAQSNELACLSGHTDKVISLSCTGDGLVCSGSLDQQVKLWKLDSISSNQINPARHYWHDGEVTSVVLSPDGSLLASASRWITSDRQFSYR